MTDSAVKPRSQSCHLNVCCILQSSYGYFLSQFGEDHPQTSSSKEFLCTITKQAVKVERSLRQAGADCMEQTVECLTSTSDAVLEQMVLMTGIRSITHRDGLQEYRKKHKELKAAVAKELGFIVTNGIVTSIVNEEEKSSDQETGNGKEAEGGGSPAVEDASESQQEQPEKESLVKSAAIANGHVVEPAEESQHEEKADAGDSDRAASDAEVKIVNGESEVRAAGQETESSAPHEVNSNITNGEVKSDATADEMKSNEVNGEINGAGDVTVSPSVLKSKGTWADVVSKADGAGKTAVNGVAGNITANGEAEE
ncbi:uncharacterized protein LOC115013677 [Cottoperca gobio]|uniref:Uncharacterized protein LOC115013677 n=1 Tax=Cottoperca gobio TaxID=56716 RepID=A0A6J2QE97_COTGO|nr:uncharacterized protein LOC115013677 [Cottoperca gobio]